MKPRLDRSLLDNVPVFRGLDDAARDEVLAAARSRLIAKNTAVFEQGQPGTSLFVLVDGRLKVSQVTPAGHHVVIRYIGPGEMFGCVAVAGQREYPGTAEAVVDTVVIAWEAATIARLMQRFPRIAMNALGTMGARVEEAHAKFRELATEQVEQRIARTVLRLANQAGKRVEGGVAIEFPLSRQDIAEMTGTTLHTVSRILSAWEQDGLIESARQRITIRKPHALVTIAEGAP